MRWSLRRGPKRLLVSLACALGIWLSRVALTAWDSPTAPAHPSPPPHSAPPTAHRPFERGRPAPGEAAPDFTLQDVEGRPFRLSREAGGVPVVLEFGSFTCPFSLAGQSDREAETLAAKYRDKVTFVFVYCPEMHPEPEGQPGFVRAMFPGYDGLPPLTQTHGRQARATRARLFRQRSKLADRVLVDEDGDRSVQRLYGAPGTGNVIVVVDARGQVAFRVLASTASAADTTLEALLAGQEPPQAPPRFRTSQPVLPR